MRALPAQAAFHQVKARHGKAETGRRMVGEEAGDGNRGNAPRGKAGERDVGREAAFGQRHAERQERAGDGCGKARQRRGRPSPDPQGVDLPARRLKTAEGSEVGGEGAFIEPGKGEGNLLRQVAITLSDKGERQVKLGFALPAGVRHAPHQAKKHPADIGRGPKGDEEAHGWAG